MALPFKENGDRSHYRVKWDENTMTVTVWRPQSKVMAQEPLCDGVLQRQSDTFNLEQGKLPKSQAMAAATEDRTKWQGSVINVDEFSGGHGEIP